MTAGRGTLFDEGPTACPFVALDRDRERRADEPDPRHRCYATPTPEPRAMAHQRVYCLTPNFTGCPIFQDWAVRAAARPVPLRPLPSFPAEEPAVEPAVTAPSEAPVGEPEMAPVVEPVDEAGDRPQQASLFDAPMVAAPEQAIVPAPGQAIVPAPTQAIIPPPIRPRPTPTPAPSPVSTPTIGPAASSRPAQASPAPVAPRGKPTLRKEDIVPAWERARYDLPEGDRHRPRRGGGDWFSRITLLFSALAILSIAVLIVLLVPILLNSRPGTTTGPSPSAAGSPKPTPSPTAAPTPQSSWLTYTIKLGDNLYRIAAQFGITYEQLLGANPQITDPTYIRAGDIINIPTPDFVPPSPSGGRTPAGSP
jgi:hypothetical protein